MTKHLLTIAGFIGVLMLSTHSASALKIGLGGTEGNQTPTSTAPQSVEEKAQIRLAQAKERANQEIDRRTTVLTTLNAKVQTMVRLTAEQKAALEKFLQDEMVSLSSLKTKIASEVDLATVKADAKSIMQSYRIFMLIVPQSHVAVAAEKIQNAAIKIAELETKLSARISEAKASGKDTAAIEAVDLDLKSNIAAAGAQASSTLAVVSGLMPDGGDQNKAAANKKVLQEARAALKSAIQQLADARADAAAILNGLKGGVVQVPQTSTATSSAQ